MIRTVEDETEGYETTSGDDTMMERLAIRDAGQWSSGFERRDSPTPRAKNGTKRSRPRRRCSRSLLLSLPGLHRWSPGVWSVVASAIVIVVANYVAVVAALQQSPPPPPSPRPMIPTSPRTVGGLPVHRTPLRTKPPGMGMIQQQQQRLPPTTMPYCFSLSSILDLPSRSNFLATQVWPSARVAAKTLEERLCLRLGIHELPPGSNNGSNSNSNNSNSNNSNANSSSTSDEEDIFTICELGCGPGLPSIAAASAAAAAEASSLASSNRRIRVVATDIDEFGLELVGAAAREQGLDHILSTRRVDLIQAGTDEFWDNDNDNNNNNNNNKNEAENNTNNNSWIRDVDLFVLSDVFECEAVALGAARLTQRILSCNTNTNHDTDTDNNNDDDDDDDDNTKSGDDTSVRRAPSRRRPRSVWVFAQTDRAQREVYLRELRRLFDETKEDDDADHSSSSLSSSLSSVVLEWSNPESYTLEDPLWLCDVDETLVDYG